MPWPVPAAVSSAQIHRDLDILVFSDYALVLPGEGIKVGETAYPALGGAGPWSATASPNLHSSHPGDEQLTSAVTWPSTCGGSAGICGRSIEEVFIFGIGSFPLLPMTKLS